MSKSQDSQRQPAMDGEAFWERHLAIVGALGFWLPLWWNEAGPCLLLVWGAVLLVLSFRGVCDSAWDKGASANLDPWGGRALYAAGTMSPPLLTAAVVGLLGLRGLAVVTVGLPGFIADSLLVALAFAAQRLVAPSARRYPAEAAALSMAALTAALAMLWPEPALAVAQQLSVSHLHAGMILLAAASGLSLAVTFLVRNAVRLTVRRSGVPFDPEAPAPGRGGSGKQAR